MVKSEKKSNLKKGGFVSAEYHSKSNTVSAPSFKMNLFPQHIVSEEHHMSSKIYNKESIMKQILSNQHGSSKSKSTKKGGNSMDSMKEQHIMKDKDTDMIFNHHMNNENPMMMKEMSSNQYGSSKSKSTKSKSTKKDENSMKSMKEMSSNQNESCKSKSTKSKSTKKDENSMKSMKEMSSNQNESSKSKSTKNKSTKSKSTKKDENSKEQYNMNKQYGGGNPFMSNYQSIGEEYSVHSNNDWVPLNGSPVDKNSSMNSTEWGSANHENSIITPKNDWAFSLNENAAIATQMGAGKNIKKKRGGNSLMDYANESGILIKSSKQWAESVGENIYPPMDIVNDYIQSGSSKDKKKKIVKKKKTEMKKKM